MSHTIHPTILVGKDDQPESEPTLDLAEDALILLESLNQLTQHGFRIVHDNTTPKAKHLERLVENPDHAIWQQYLTQKYELSSREWVTVKTYFKGSFGALYYHTYLRGLRLCRWFTAMHDRSEQYRENSPQLCRERHARIFSALSATRTWGLKMLLEDQFPRIIGVLSIVVPFDMNSDRPLKVWDQYLSLPEPSRLYYWYHDELNQVLVGTPYHICRFCPTALESLKELFHTIEQVRVMIRHHFPGATGNELRPSRKSIASFLSDLRDAGFPGPLGLFFHCYFLKWIGMLILHTSYNDESPPKLNHWLLIERLFIFADEFVRTMRVVGPWEALCCPSESKRHFFLGQLLRFSENFGELAWIGDRFRGLSNESEYCSSCQSLCNQKKKSILQEEYWEFTSNCAAGRLYIGGLSISHSQTIPPSKHWCQCCMDEIGDKLCGRKFGPCCKGHMGPPVSTTSYYDSASSESDGS
ncbi:hypothetical protein BDZ91DRAFT_741812 [Kalaharituber pfeilii]|nr:hypothetical protein BDZ91DRAFT_741812 [Kalaharituber pfeilii]